MRASQHPVLTSLPFPPAQACVSPSSSRSPGPHPHPVLPEGTGQAVCPPPHPRCPAPRVRVCVRVRAHSPARPSCRGTVAARAVTLWAEQAPRPRREEMPAPPRRLEPRLGEALPAGGPEGLGRGWAPSRVCRTLEVLGDGLSPSRPRQVTPVVRGCSLAPVPWPAGRLVPGCRSEGICSVPGENPPERLCRVWL